jgi:hypothetical protein
MEPLYTIIVRDGDREVSRRKADTRAQADQIFGEEERAHPNCEIRLMKGEATFVSAGPRAEAEGAGSRRR